MPEKFIPHSYSFTDPAFYEILMGFRQHPNIVKYELHEDSYVLTAHDRHVGRSRSFVMHFGGLVKVTRQDTKKIISAVLLLPTGSEYYTIEMIGLMKSAGQIFERRPLNAETAARLQRTAVRSFHMLRTICYDTRWPT